MSLEVIDNNQPSSRGSACDVYQRMGAVRSGLEFLDRISQDDDVLDTWAGDFLWCFYTISETAAWVSLRKVAKEMGLRAAEQWHSRHRSLPKLESAEEVTTAMAVVDVLVRLGIDACALREHVASSTAKFTAQDYLHFNPKEEAPPFDVPHECLTCGIVPERGATHCSCGDRVVTRSPYEVWRAALVLTYTADIFGAPLPATYRDVLKWLPRMRQYPGWRCPDFREVEYAVTHIVYTLNDYHRYRLSPDWLPHEYQFLESNLRNVIESRDAELVGEFLDCLRAFDVSICNPSIQAGIDFLLSAQNTDGSWGDSHEDDILAVCHSTWTAIDALRDYSWPHKRCLTGLLFSCLESAPVS